MERITINAEFLFELKSKNQWVQRVPQIIPEKTRSGEKLIWVDSVGNVFESGLDFEEAEKLSTYPCRVYRPFNVGGYTPPSQPSEQKPPEAKCPTCGKSVKSWGSSEPTFCSDSFHLSPEDVSKGAEEILKKHFLLGKKIRYRYVDWEDGSFTPWSPCTERELKTILEDHSIEIVQFKP